MKTALLASLVLLVPLAFLDLASADPVSCEGTVEVKCFDCDTWVKKDGKWVCTESSWCTLYVSEVCAR